MALTPDFNQTAEAASGDDWVITFTDATVYGTSGNPARNTLAVFFDTQKYAKDSTVESEFTPVTYDPLTATTFQFTLSSDGWYKSKFAIIPLFNIATAYVIYDAVRYTNGNVYRAITSSTGNLPTDTNYFTLISDPISLIANDGTASESNNISFEIVDLIIYPNSKKGYGIVTSRNDCCSDCERTERILNYEYAGSLVDAMDTANQQQKYAKGESVAREAEVFFDNVL